MMEDCRTATVQDYQWSSQKGWHWETVKCQQYVAQQPQQSASDILVVPAMFLSGIAIIVLLVYAWLKFAIFAGIYITKGIEKGLDK